jgi:hypothetical protein
MFQLRTLDEAMAKIKKKDPDTSLTRYALRQAVLEGRIPCVMCGRKRLVDVARVFAYLTGTAESEVQSYDNTDNRSR